MFRFENQAWLYALLLIPALVILYQLSARWRKNALARLGDADLLGRLMPDFSGRKRRNKFILFVLAYAFLVVGLANPQLGTKLERIQRQGIDVFIAIDVSKSMLAEDLQPSRLERAKQLVSRLVGTMKDDRVGIIVFAGHAYLQMPLTIDYAAAGLFLKTISPDMVPSQGTAIAEAIELALQSYDEGDKEAKHKALIIISDGEDHEEGVLEAAELAADEGVAVYALGIGSEEGGAIPEYVNGRRMGYKKDPQTGGMVVSKLNEEVLDQIAEAGSGTYFRIRGAKNEVGEVLKVLDSIEKKDYEGRVFTDYADQFQYFLAIALALLLIDFFVSERKTGWFANWSLFGEPPRKG